MKNVFLNEMNCSVVEINEMGVLKELVDGR